MLIKNSIYIQDAVNKGYVEIDDSAVISSTVRIVAEEDDGKNYGKILIGKNTIVRENVIICSGVKIGDCVQVGHMTVLRKNVIIGNNVTLSHLSNIERDTVIGNNVRISALTHITGSCVIEDGVQIGARVVTINDNKLAWGTNPELTACIFRRGCRVGSGVTIMGGVEIGAYSLIGAGSLVLKTIPERVIAYGHPAYVQRDRLFEHNE
jgi:acetyltransferase-like isoleucine patch superfamily enzyme